MIYLLQQAQQKDLSAYLVIGITALTSALVWAVLEIRKLNIQRVEDNKKSTQVIVEVTKDFVQTTAEFKSAVEANTKSQDNLAGIVRDLHDVILSSTFLNPKKTVNR